MLKVHGGAAKERIMFQVIGRSFLRMYYNKSELFYQSANNLYIKCSQVWLLSHMVRMCCDPHNVILKS